MHNLEGGCSYLISQRMETEVAFILGLNPSHWFRCRKGPKQMMGFQILLRGQSCIKNSVVVLCRYASDSHTCVDTKHNELMAIYFTSGTTGPPKMIGHTHSSFGLGLSVNGRYFPRTVPTVHNLQKEWSVDWLLKKLFSNKLDTFVNLYI